MMLAHVAAVGVAGELLNLTAAYMSSPDGSGEEELAEAALTDAMSEACDMPLAGLMNIMMTFTSLIVGTSDPEEVQRWFNQQGQHAREVFDGRSAEG
jgi:hypothetical protein